MSINSSWYYPISREAAKNLLLKHGRPGHFLVRNSSKEGQFSISVRRANDVLNIKIFNNGDSYDISNRKEDESFASLYELIEHYTKKDKLQEKNDDNIDLLFAFRGEPVTNERWYHGAITSEEAAKRLKHHGKQFSFLVRDRTLDGYALCVLIDPGCVRQYVVAQEDGKYYIPSRESRHKGDSLPELVNIFKHESFTDDDGGKQIKLGEPVLDSCDLPVAATRLPVQQVVKREAYIEEFEELQRMENQNQTSRSEGQRPENKTRNRYKNILPFDHSRIILHNGNPSEIGSDYINANYIKNSLNHKVYIATQGCLVTTVPDFWRMVWQENSRIIVMITKLVEQGKNKCYRYWPEKGEMVEAIYQARIVVTFVSKTTSPDRDYDIREFKLSLEIENCDVPGEYVPAIGGSRTIFQYNYIAWPDKSVPKQPESVLKLLHAVTEKQASLKQAGPVIVHCSAGIGRTGTFIVIGLVIDQIVRFGDTDISIKKTLAEVRSQRSGMVQTEAQYKFIDQMLECFRKSCGKDQGQLYANYPRVDNGQLYANVST